MARKKIHVTVEDIANGKLGSAQCPLAQALNRETGLKTSVGRHDWLTMGIARGPFRLPKSARRAISAFDRGSLLKPFNFFTDVPDA